MPYSLEKTDGSWIKEEVLSLFFPRRCPICEQPCGRALVHEHCKNALPYLREPVCQRCGRALEDNRQEYCSACMAKEPEFRRGRAVFRYEGAVRESILRMKFHNRREYLDFYASEMAVCFDRYFARSSYECMVPVPMHRRKRQERGFDQCSLLSEKLSRLIGVPVNDRAIQRARYTKAQKGLGEAQRRKNVHSAFAAGPEIPAGGPVLVIDDIFTTGATINEVCRVLKEHGAAPVDFLVLSGDTLKN